MGGSHAFDVVDEAATTERGDNLLGGGIAPGAVAVVLTVETVSVLDDLADRTGGSLIAELGRNADVSNRVTIRELALETDSLGSVVETVEANLDGALVVNVDATVDDEDWLLDVDDTAVVTADGVAAAGHGGFRGKAIKILFFISIKIIFGPKFGFRF